MEDCLDDVGVPLQEIKNRNYVELFENDLISVSHRIGDLEKKAHSMARDIMDYYTNRFLEESQKSGRDTPRRGLWQYLLQVYTSTIIKMYKMIDNHNNKIIGSINLESYIDDEGQPLVHFEVTLNSDKFGGPYVQYIINPSLINRN